MQLLITPALTLSADEKAALEGRHTLHFLEDERISLSEQTLSFDPATIEGIVCNVFFLHNDLDVFPRLKIIQLMSAGLDRVPLSEIRKRGIALYNAGAAYAVPMAEWALAKILEIMKHSAAFAASQAAHRWEKQRDLRELSGRSAAIIGFGNVGKAVAKRLTAFDVSITAVDVVPPDGCCDAYLPIARLDEALSGADIVVLSLPLTDETRGLINADRLAAMKDDAVLVNVARGAVLDEAALLNALQSGKLAGAALDVFAYEPLSADSPLWEAPRLLLSPHNSFVSDGNHDRLFAIVKEHFL